MNKGSSPRPPTCYSQSRYCKQLPGGVPERTSGYVHTDSVSKKLRIRCCSAVEDRLLREKIMVLGKFLELSEGATVKLRPETGRVGR